MNETINISLFMLSGACAYASFFHLSSGLRRPINYTQILFAAMSLMVLLFSFSQRQALNAHTIGEAVIALKLNHAGAILYYTLLLWFIVFYTEKRVTSFALGMTLAGTVLFVVNLVQPYSLQYRFISELKTVQLPWGEIISLPGGIPSLWFKIGIAFLGLDYIYFFYALISFYRDTRNQFTLGIIFTLALFLACTIQGILVRLGIIDFLHLGMFGYLGMILCTSLLLSYENHARLKQANQALSLSETQQLTAHQRLQTLIQTLPDLIWLKDVQGIYLACNQRFERFFGKTEQEIVGKTDYDFINKEQADFFRKHDQAAIQKGGPSCNEEWICFADDGHSELLETTKSPMYDFQGQLIGVLGIGHDITEYRRALELLERSENNLRAILNATSECVKLVSREGIVLSMNLAGLANIEADSENSVINKPFQTFLAPEHHEAFQNFNARICSGESGSIEFEIIGLKGTRRWMETRAVPFKSERQGEVVQLAFTQDITKRKQADWREKSHRRTLELMASGAPLANILETIVRCVEQEDPAMLCSILILDKARKHLLHGAAPSLPDFYNATIHGIEIGVGVGSCGTAACTGQRVIVDDIKNHPYWAPYITLANQAGLGACWSEPILSPQGIVLGTFAIYHRDVHLPQPDDILLIEQTAHLASIALEKNRADLALRESEKHFRSLFESTRDALVIFMSDGVCLDGNPAAIEMFECQDISELIGKTPVSVSPEFQPDGRRSAEKAMEMIQMTIENGSNLFEWTHKRKDGAEFPVEVLLTYIPLADKTVLVSNSRDISDRKLMEAKLQLAASVFTHAREGILITDAEGVILEVNDTFISISGYSRTEIIGQNPRLFQSDRQSPEFYVNMWQALTEKGYWYGEIWNRRKNGAIHAELLTISAVYNAAGKIQNYVGLFTDITPMKEHQKYLEHIAHYDALTNLPNRVLLADRLQQAMNQCERRKLSLAVIYLDLDGFKKVNDHYGHHAGDEILIAISLRMKEILREGDTLARIGGDEFVIVLVDLEQTSDYESILKRLLIATAKPLMLGNAILHLSASMGVTLFPQDNADADQLMRHADQAMYLAKQSGKNRYHLFDVEHNAAVQTLHERLLQIHRAIDQQQFVLYYQPKVNMRTGKIIGAEALIRWRNPEHGMLLPNEFLPIIEDHPLTIALGEWVINATMAQMSIWRNAGLDIPVSVNISARQLQQNDFVLRLSSILATYPNLRPGALELEVLETSELENIAQLTQTMQACRNFGVRFALDDFGTGYSSLTYLKHFPIDILKIDQSFVRNMLADADDLAIVEGVMGLAKAFRLQVIAEGVETIEHGSQLLEMGCDFAQGYAIAKPMLAEDILKWVADWKPITEWSAYSSSQSV